MLSPIAAMKQHIHERRSLCLKVERVDMGRGFYIEAVNLDLFLGHEDDPVDRARCGRVDGMHDGRWILDRDWLVLFMDTFGQLPANCVVEGDAE